MSSILFRVLRPHSIYRPRDNGSGNGGHASHRMCVCARVCCHKAFGWQPCAFVPNVVVVVIVSLFDIRCQHHIIVVGIAIPFARMPRQSYRNWSDDEHKSLRCVLYVNVDVIYWMVASEFTFVRCFRRCAVPLRAEWKIVSVRTFCDNVVEADGRINLETTKTGYESIPRNFVAQLVRCIRFQIETHSVERMRCAGTMRESEEDAAWCCKRNTFRMKMCAVCKYWQ